MKSAYSVTWKSSTQPRKQRKYLYNAPAHVASKSVSSHLTDELKKKYGVRSMRVRTGDKVKIVRGQRRGETGKVERIDVSRRKVFLTKVEIIKKDGTKTLVPLEPSNLIITELNMEDKRRLKKPEGESKNG